MRNEHFDVPITVDGERLGHARIVADTVQAAATLLEGWPEDLRGPKYRAALRTCMDVLEQRKSVASARKAFIAAAREARLSVREGRH